MQGASLSRIAIIDPSLFTWPYDSALAQGLRANGHEVIVYGKHLAAGDEAKGAEGLRELFYPGFQGPPIGNLPYALFYALKGLDHVESSVRLIAALRRFRPDFIHFQWTVLPVFDRWVIPAFRRIAPTVLTVHDSAPFNDNPRSRVLWLNAISIMEGFDQLIVHTERARTRLIDYGIAAERVARVPHGVLGLSAGENTVPAEPVNDPDRPVTFLLFGRIKPYKGVDVMLRALAAMPPAARARSRAHIVGRPFIDMEPLFALSRELGVESQVEWTLRFVADEEMAGIFGAADALVLPYREIDASGVLMVALAAGRPILASRIGLFAEMLEEGRHGFLVPPDDPAALAEALAAVVNDPERRVRMGRAVRDLMAAIPDWREIGRMTMEAYQAAARRQKGRRAS